MLEQMIESQTGSELELIHLLSSLQALETVRFLHDETFQSPHKSYGKSCCAAAHTSRLSEGRCLSFARQIICFIFSEVNKLLV